MQINSLPAYPEIFGHPDLGYPYLDIFEVLFLCARMLLIRPVLRDRKKISATLP